MTEPLNDAALMTRPRAEIGRLSTRSLMFGGIGLAGAAIGLFTSRETFLQSYLIAFIFWMGLTIGPLAVLMIQHLSGGVWGLVARRTLEAATRTLPLMALLFIPIALNLPVLYEWARPEAASVKAIAQKAAYLNVPAFQMRAVIFFVIWGTLAYFLNKWSREQDEQPTQLPGPKDRRSRVLSGPGLVLYVLTITFMSVDWVMSLDPRWYSTIFGVLQIGGQGLSTMAFVIVVLSSLVKFRPMSELASAETFHDLGKLMFGFVLLWAYFSISQLLITWSANLPEEIPFYLQRLTGIWAPISIAVLVLQFVLPFVLLLSRDLKRNPAAVRWVALLILIMRVVDITWTIGPVFRKDGSTLHLLDFAMVLGMGCLWLPLFWRNLAGRPLVPAHDPYFQEVMADVRH